MPLGPDSFNLTLHLHSVFCFQGDDYDVVFDSDSEPYLWVFMIKIDGEGLHQDGNHLAGEATYFFSPGSHGNIGGSITRGTRQLPHSVGLWDTSLRPIPISVAGYELTTIPGTILCAAILMEENLTPNPAVEAAHQSVINLVKTTVANTLASLGLAGLAADALAEVATEALDGRAITLADAAQRVLRRRLKPIQDLFTVAASASAVVTILSNLDLEGLIGSGVDADKPMGVFNQVFGQAELARTVESAHWDSNGYRIDINSKMWNLPEWAYTLHGQAYAHHRFDRQQLPSADRLEVTCSSKRRMRFGQTRITGIGGTSDGGYWAMSRSEAAELIRAGEKSFFVRGPDGRTVEVDAVQGEYEHVTPFLFLQTRSDQDPTNNLLTLPDCSAGGYTVEVWY